MYTTNPDDFQQIKLIRDGVGYNPEEEKQNTLEDYEKKYSDAFKIDEANYIKFFGTDEEKKAYAEEQQHILELKKQEEIRIEQERLKKLEDERLAKELEDLQNKLADAKERKNLIANSDVGLDKIRKYISDLEFNYRKITNVDAIYWETITNENVDYVQKVQDLSLTISDLKVDLENIKSDIYRKSLEELRLYDVDATSNNLRLACMKALHKSKYLVLKAERVVGRYYDIKTTALIEKHLSNIFMYIVQEIEKRDVYFVHEFVIPMKYKGLLDEDLSYTIKITRDSLGKIHLAVTYDANIRSTYSYYTKHNGFIQIFEYIDWGIKCDMSATFDVLFVEVISKQWHDYFCDIEQRESKGLKNRFLEKLEEFDVKTKLEQLDIKGDD